MNGRRFIPVAEPVIGQREVELVSDAVRSGWVSSIGRYITEFEEGIARMAGTRHAVAVSNGTSALQLALATAGIGGGDEVLVPSLTFIATANAVRYTGATPVFCESDAAHWCIDPEDAARRVTSRTRAIVPVHVFGQPADMDALNALASAHGLIVIEDAAEALGTEFRGRPAGSLGDAGVFSFYGNKLITSGEGGMLVTDDDATAARARMLRDHAMDPERRYWHDEIGFNFRMTNMQAALGVAQLERADSLLRKKRAIKRRYRDGLSRVPGIRLQTEPSWATSSCWMTTVRIGAQFPMTRDELARALAAEGIDTRPVFVPTHMLPPYDDGTRLPIAEAIAADGLTLPSGATLTDDEQTHIVERVREYATLARAA